MVLTETQLQDIAVRVRSIIRAESKGVGDLPIAESLEGIVSLPALKFNGGVPEVVEAPMGLFVKASEDANTAAATALEAAERAATATENATEVANNPTKIESDNYVYRYDLENRAYVKTDIYVRGDQGPKGDDPIKGTDYWTQDDQQSILSACESYIDQALSATNTRVLGITAKI